MGIGALMMPDFLLGNPVDPSHFLNEYIDRSAKKSLADIALNTAKSKGASYADVRIGRYLQQNISTRETRVQSIANSESYGIGIRVIVNGTWGFSATSEVTEGSVIKCAQSAAAIAKANA